MISKLHVQNFKCLRDVTVELAPLTVLIGKNDTGKTSLLEAIETLGGLVAVNPDLPRAFKKLMWHDADPRSIGWSVEIAPSDRNHLPAPSTYSLRIAEPNVPSLKWRSSDESLSIPGLDVSLAMESQALRGRENGVSFVHQSEPRPGLAWARTQAELPTIGAVAQALSGATKYRFDPSRLNQPNPFVTRGAGSREAPRLAPDGGGLALVLDYLLGAKRKIFDTIERELHEAVPFIKSIQINPWEEDAAPPRFGRALSFGLASADREISADSVSDGVLLFLAYLTLVNAPDPPSTLLIEEPENGVHPRQLQRIAEYLKHLSDPARGASAVQIITATHSPYFLDFVEPSSVLVFGRRPNGETVVAPLLSLPGVRQRLHSGFSLGEMWFNVGEDRLLAEVLK